MIKFLDIGQATQWDGTPQGAKRILDWILGAGSKASYYYAYNNPSIAIETPDGILNAASGDWILRDSDDHFWPYTPEEFEDLTGEPEQPDKQ
jgi:hypothetical protein